MLALLAQATTSQFLQAPLQWSVVKNALPSKGGAASKK